MATLELIAQSRRLTILRCLAEQNGKTLNASVMLTILPNWGFVELPNTVENDFIWLGEQGLVKCDDELDDVVIATLTERGLYVSKGLAKCKGVATPSLD